MPERGAYIVFEGSDGSGKSHQQRMTVDALSAAGEDVVDIFEPGYSQAGRQIRRILLDPETGHLAPATELLLFTADRSETWHQVTQPALERGQVVLSDRNYYSSWVYQGASDPALGDAVVAVARHMLPHRYCVPDQVFVIEIPEHERLRRLREQDNFIADRIESRQGEFFQRVSERYARLKDEFGAISIDGTGTPEEVNARIIEKIKKVI